MLTVGTKLLELLKSIGLAWSVALVGWALALLLWISWPNPVVPTQVVHETEARSRKTVVTVDDGEVEQTPVAEVAATGTPNRDRILARGRHITIETEGSASVSFDSTQPVVPVSRSFFAIGPTVSLMSNPTRIGGQAIFGIKGRSWLGGGLSISGDSATPGQFGTYLVRVGALLVF